MSRLEKEPVFVVEINRLDNSFSFSKKGLNEIEQMAMELFLQQYVDANRELRKHDMIEALDDDFEDTLK